MYAIILHYTDTEEIMGTVVALQEVDATDIFNKVYRSWANFNNINKDLGELDDPIEDFIEYHNDNSDVEITSLYVDYIQL